MVGLSGKETVMTAMTLTSARRTTRPIGLTLSSLAALALAGQAGAFG